MTARALQVINDEHVAVAAMLRSLNMLLRKSRDEKRAPPFDVLRAMLFYVDEFPERLHHTKESQLLFPRVRARCPELAPVLDQLDADHALGEASIRELEHRMLAYEVMGESRIALVLGAEGEGMRQNTEAHCDELAKLPISPKVESLNVSNAAAVALYAVVTRG